MENIEDLYDAADYSGCKIGTLNFYYGYEQTRCKVHSSTEECLEDDCTDNEYCFVIWDKDEEVFRLSKSEIEDRVERGRALQEDNMLSYLTAGIVLYFTSVDL